MTPAPTMPVQLNNFTVFVMEQSQCFQSYSTHSERVTNECFSQESSRTKSVSLFGQIRILLSDEVMFGDLPSEFPAEKRIGQDNGREGPRAEYRAQQFPTKSTDININVYVLGAGLTRAIAYAH